MTRRPFKAVGRDEGVIIASGGGFGRAERTHGPAAHSRNSGDMSTKALLKQQRMPILFVPPVPLLKSGSYGWLEDFPQGCSWPQVSRSLTPKFSGRSAGVVRGEANVLGRSGHRSETSCSKWCPGCLAGETTSKRRSLFRREKRLQTLTRVVWAKPQLTSCGLVDRIVIVQGNERLDRAQRALSSGARNRKGVYTPLTLRFARNERPPRNG